MPDLVPKFLRRKNWKIKKGLYRKNNDSYKNDDFQSSVNQEKHSSE